MYIYIFGKMERYGALPNMAESQNRKQALVGKLSASSMGAHLAVDMGGFGQWDHRVPQGHAMAHR